MDGMMVMVMMMGVGKEEGGVGVDVAVWFDEP